MTNKKALFISKLLVLLVSLTACGVLYYHSYNDQAVISPYWIDVIDYVETEMLIILGVGIASLIALFVIGKKIPASEANNVYNAPSKTKKEETKSKTKVKVPKIPDDAQLKQEPVVKPVVEQPSVEESDEDLLEQALSTNPVVQTDYYERTHRHTNKQQMPQTTIQPNRTTQPANQSVSRNQIPATKADYAVRSNEHNIYEEHQQPQQPQRPVSPQPATAQIYQAANTSGMQQVQNRVPTQTQMAIETTQQRAVAYDVQKPTTTRPVNKINYYTAESVVKQEEVKGNDDNYFDELQALFDSMPNKNILVKQNTAQNVGQEETPEYDTTFDADRPAYIPHEEHTEPDPEESAYEEPKNTVEPVEEPAKEEPTYNEPKRFISNEAPGFDNGSNFTVDEALFLDKLSSTMEHADVPENLYSLGKYVHGRISIYPTMSPNQYGKCVRKWCVSTRNGIVACGADSIEEAIKVFAKIIRTN